MDIYYLFIIFHILCKAELIFIYVYLYICVCVGVSFSTSVHLGH